MRQHGSFLSDITSTGSDTRLVYMSLVLRFLSVVKDRFKGPCTEIFAYSFFLILLIHGKEQMGLRNLDALCGIFPSSLMSAFLTAKTCRE